MSLVNKDSIPINVVSEVLRTVQKIGVERTVYGLRMIAIDDDGHKEVSEIIIGSVCEHTEMSRRAIFSGKTKGNRPNAIMFILVLHEKILGYDCEQLHILFSIPYDTVYRYLCKFKKLSDKHKSESKLLTDFDSIKDVVNSKVEGKHISPLRK